MSVYKNDIPEYFCIALDSIINQTMPPSEIVLTIDGPVLEDLNAAIAKYEKKYSLLKVVRLIENKGLGIAHQIGVNNCTNELIAVMDSDDIAVSNRFEKQVKCFMAEPNLDILGGYISEFVGQVDNVVGIREVPLDDKNIKNYLKWRCPLNHMTIMFKKSSVLKAGNYQDWHYDEDSYLFCRMYLVGCIFRNIPDILCHVRVGKEMYKRRGGWKYFASEAGLMRFMLNNKIIILYQYLINIFLRFVIQVLMPDNIRGFIFKYLFRKFARTK
jgi:glycosyltransferase involved in cell wall biosynthesis